MAQVQRKVLKGGVERAYLLISATNCPSTGSVRPAGLRYSPNGPLAKEQKPLRLNCRESALISDRTGRYLWSSTYKIFQDFVPIKKSRQKCRLPE